MTSLVNFLTDQDGRVDGSTLACEVVMSESSTSHGTPAHEQPCPPELNVTSVWL